MIAAELIAATQGLAIYSVMAEKRLDQILLSLQLFYWRYWVK